MPLEYDPELTYGLINNLRQRPITEMALSLWVHEFHLVTDITRPPGGGAEVQKTVLAGAEK
jgi:hypothetical protein